MLRYQRAEASAGHGICNSLVLICGTSKDSIARLSESGCERSEGGKTFSISLASVDGLYISFYINGFLGST